MNAPGAKLKLVNAIDNQMSDDLQALYKIEIALGKSPKHGVKCGAIVIFKQNNIDMDFTKDATPQEISDIQSGVDSQTEVMYRDPELFKETDGQWIAWAVQRTMEIFDELGTNAQISVKCSKLRIIQKVSRNTIIKGRGDLRSTFKVVWDIDRLLTRGYEWDPWTNSVRRGRIGAEFSKR